MPFRHLRHNTISRVSPPSILLQGLAAYWKLDEASGVRYPVYHDGLSANGYQLTDNNTVTSTTGKHNTCAQFTAANSEYLSLSLANSGSLVQDGTSSFSFVLWVKPNSTTVNGDVFGRYTATGNQRSYILLQLSSGNWRWAVSDDGATAGNLEVTAPSAGAWSMVCCRYDTSTKKHDISINNGTVSTYSLTIDPIFVGTSVWGIGSAQAGAGTEFDGCIDSFGFWTKYLSSKEVTMLYANGNGLTYPFQ